MSALAPVRLAPNQPADRPYRGGQGIRALRGVGSGDTHVPEDFVASTTTVFGSDHVGLTVLPSGETLRDAVARDPEGWLGAAHVARFGGETELLVKILSTGERLFNHFHPDGVFAREHFGAPRGKTEAWLITDTGSSPVGQVWLGFRRPVTVAEVAALFEAQDHDALVEALAPVDVRAGDSVYVPAGTPHAIGQGITLVELQEPADLSILLEYAGYPGLDREKALIGLTVAEALDGLDTRPLDAAGLARLHRSAAGDASVENLLPVEADEFFRASQLNVEAPVEIAAGYSVLVVQGGSGSLTWQSGSLALRRGDVLVVPAGIGATTISGGLRALRCEPPRP